MSFLRRFLAAVTHSGPGYTPTPHPARGDAVEVWLKARRDATAAWDEWYALNALLNQYRRHADTRTPLDQRTDTEVPF